MALADILEAIRRDTEAEIEAVRAAADREVGAILAAADDEAERVAAAAGHSRDREAESAAARIRNEAALEAERELRAAREATFQQALEQVEARLRRLRSESGYREVQHRLLSEARAVLPQGEVVLVDPADAELTEDLLAAAGAAATRVEASRRCWGGVDLATGDGRLLRNTLEARLERAGTRLRWLAAELISQLRGGGP